MKANKDINNFKPSPLITPIQESDKEVLVDAGLKDLVLIKAPENIDLTLCKLIIKYLNSVKFKGLATPTRNRERNNLQLFFKFVENKGWKKDSDVPVKVFDEFTQFVKNNTRGQGNSVGNTVKVAAKALKWYVDANKSAKAQNSERELVAKYLSFLPKFQRLDSNARPSLSEMFPECPYTDRELIRSLRLVCCWVILEYSSHRSELLEDKDVQKELAKLKGKDLTKPPLSKSTHHAKDSLYSYAVLINTVNKINDDVLSERLLSSIPSIDIESMSSIDLKDFSYRLLLDDKSKLKTQVYKDSKTYNIPSINTLTFQDLLIPSEVEVFATNTFFAAERLQTSNLQRLQISDVSSNIRGTQTQHVKIRRIKKKQKNVTDIYPPNELVSDSLNEYFYILKKGQEYLPDEFKGLAFPYLNNVYENVYFIFNYKGVVSRFFDLLLKETKTRQSLFENITEADASPFLWILQNMHPINSLVSEQEAEYNRQLKSAKKTGNKISRSQIVTTKKISLSPSYICQSRVIMDSGVNVSEKTENSDKLPTSENDDVDAALTAHSPSTKKNTYFDRSNNKEVIASRKQFAIQMGEMMEHDAAKMREMMKSVNVVSLEQAKELLGCKSSEDNFLALLGEENLDVGLTGEIFHGEEVIFVATPLIAALIIKKINHIDSEIPNLLLDSPEFHIKGVNALSEKAYFQTILESFPEDIQEEGKKLSETFEMPYASML
jgi:hypothetical protein